MNTKPNNKFTKQIEELVALHPDKFKKISWYDKGFNITDPYCAIGILSSPSNPYCKTNEIIKLEAKTWCGVLKALNQYLVDFEEWERINDEEERRA